MRRAKMGAMASGSLQRPPRGQGRVLVGVCAALANRFGISVLLIRLLFVIFAITGVGELVYLALWIIIPKGSRY
jgi:phage shock protein PspC (stress-responsive transcriptional regulator)